VSFGSYILGFLILIGGLIYGAEPQYYMSAANGIAAGAMVLLGRTILRGAQVTRGIRSIVTVGPLPVPELLMA
jgi:hypothetical protein